MVHEEGSDEMTGLGRMESGEAVESGVRGDSWQWWWKFGTFPNVLGNQAHVSAGGAAVSVSEEREVGNRHMGG